MKQLLLFAASAFVLLILAFALAQAQDRAPEAETSPASVSHLNRFKETETVLLEEDDPLGEEMDRLIEGVDLWTTDD